MARQATEDELILHNGFKYILEESRLDDADRADLKKRGLSDAFIDAMGFKSMPRSLQEGEELMGRVLTKHPEMKDWIEDKKIPGCSHDSRTGAYAFIWENGYFCPAYNDSIRTPDGPLFAGIQYRKTRELLPDDVKLHYPGSRGRQGDKKYIWLSGASTSSGKLAYDGNIVENESTDTEIAVDASMVNSIYAQGPHKLVSAEYDAMPDRQKFMTDKDGKDHPIVIVTEGVLKSSIAYYNLGGKYTVIGVPGTESVLSSYETLKDTMKDAYVLEAFDADKDENPNVERASHKLCEDAVKRFGAYACESITWPHNEADIKKAFEGCKFIPTPSDTKGIDDISNAVRLNGGGKLPMHFNELNGRFVTREKDMGNFTAGSADLNEHPNLSPYGKKLSKSVAATAATYGLDMSPDGLAMSDTVIDSSLGKRLGKVIFAPDVEPIPDSDLKLGIGINKKEADKTKDMQKGSKGMTVEQFLNGAASPDRTSNRVVDINETIYGKNNELNPGEAAYNLRYSALREHERGDDESFLDKLTPQMRSIVEKPFIKYAERVRDIEDYQINNKDTLGYPDLAKCEMAKSDDLQALQSDIQKGLKENHMTIQPADASVMQDMWQTLGAEALYNKQAEPGTKLYSDNRASKMGYSFHQKPDAKHFANSMDQMSRTSSPLLDKMPDKMLVTPMGAYLCAEPEDLTAKMGVPRTEHYRVEGSMLQKYPGTNHAVICPAHVADKNGRPSSSMRLEYKEGDATKKAQVLIPVTAVIGQEAAEKQLINVDEKVRELPKSARIKQGNAMRAMVDAANTALSTPVATKKYHEIQSAQAQMQGQITSPAD